MFRKERHAEILRLLDRQGRVEVEDLAAHYGVSCDSIRKDLQYLDKHGLCKRVYGGALKSADVSALNNFLHPSVDSKLSTHPDSQRTKQRVDELIPSLNHALSPEPQTAQNSNTQDHTDTNRWAVAKRAYLEINDGDSIFLDLSRINIELARLLAQGNKHVIVTTNMLDVIKILSDAPHITTLATGGFLNIKLNGFVGSETISLLEPLLFLKAFIGAGSIDLDQMAVSCDNIDGGAVKEKVIHNASYTFLLADKDKFNREEQYRFATITDFSAIITDCNDEVVLRKLRTTGTPILQA